MVEITLMDLLHYVFFFLVALGVLVTIHEAGHLLIARLSGVHVVRFCIGFGKVIFSRRDRRGTEFCIAALPLGGYVRMYDQRDPDAASHAPPETAPAVLSYDQLTPQWRIAIALGGPVANFVLAFVLYWLIAVIGVTAALPLVGGVTGDSPAHRAGLRDGAEIVAVDGTPTATWPDVLLALAARLGDSGHIEIAAARAGRVEAHSIPIEDWHAGTDDPDPIGSLGIGLAPLAIIGQVLEGEPAQRGGLEAMDRVTHVDGQAIDLWEEFVALVQASPDQTLRLTVARESGVQSLRVTPRVNDGRGYIGAAVGMPRRVVRFGVIEAVAHAAAETWSKSALTVGLLGKMITGSISSKNLAGPITIAKVAGDSARAGPVRFLSILALLSISLGIINLLPIPVLDGGQVVFNAVELVRRRPVPAWAEAVGARIGLAMVLGIMLLVFYYDVTRWFWPGS